MAEGIEGLGYRPISQLPDGNVVETNDTTVVVRLGITRKAKLGSASSRDIGTANNQIRDNTLLLQKFDEVEVEVDDKFTNARQVSDGKYLHALNDLNDLNSVSDARLNLGLGDVATRTIGTDPNQIRDNTLLDSVIQSINDDIDSLETDIEQDFINFRSTSDNKYLHVNNNLGDVNNTETTRTNLSVYSRTEVENIAQEEALLAAVLYG